MGRCSKCGRKIEYNNFVVVDGIVYHRECAPKKEETSIEKVVEEIQKYGVVGFTNATVKDIIADNPVMKKKPRKRSRK